MSSKSRKTVLRTTRYTKEMLEILQEDAKNKGVNVSALISMIMTKYVEWDRYADKIGFVSLTHEGLKFLLDATDDAKLAQVTGEAGSTMTREFMLFTFKELTLSAFLEGLSRWCRYARIGELESRVEGSRGMFTIHHDYGEKWSRFMAPFLANAMKAILKISPDYEVSKNSFIFRFSASARLAG